MTGSARDDDAAPERGHGSACGHGGRGPGKETGGGCHDARARCGPRDNGDRRRIASDGPSGDRHGGERACASGSVSASVHGERELRAAGCPATEEGEAPVGGCVLAGADAGPMSE